MEASLRLCNVTKPALINPRIRIGPNPGIEEISSGTVVARPEFPSFPESSFRLSELSESGTEASFFPFLPALLLSIMFSWDFSISIVSLLGSLFIRRTQSRQLRSCQLCKGALEVSSSAATSSSKNCSKHRFSFRRLHSSIISRNQASRSSRISIHRVNSP